jgi:hypothetical protein
MTPSRILSLLLILFVYSIGIIGLFIVPFDGIALIWGFTAVLIIYNKANNPSSPVIWRILLYALLSVYTIYQFWLLFTGGIPFHTLSRTDTTFDVVFKKINGIVFTLLMSYGMVVCWKSVLEEIKSKGNKKTNGEA